MTFPVEASPLSGILEILICEGNLLNGHITVYETAAFFNKFGQACKTLLAAKLSGYFDVVNNIMVIPSVHPTLIVYNKVLNGAVIQNANHLLCFFKGSHGKKLIVLKSAEGRFSLYRTEDIHVKLNILCLIAHRRILTENHLAIILRHSRITVIFLLFGKYMIGLRQICTVHILLKYRHRVRGTGNGNVFQVTQLVHRICVIVIVQYTGNHRVDRCIGFTVVESYQHRAAILLNPVNRKLNILCDIFLRHQGVQQILTVYIFRIEAVACHLSVVEMNQRAGTAGNQEVTFRTVVSLRIEERKNLEIIQRSSAALYNLLCRNRYAHAVINQTVFQRNHNGNRFGNFNTGIFHIGTIIVHRITDGNQRCLNLRNGMRIDIALEKLQITFSVVHLLILTADCTVKRLVSFL